MPTANATSPSKTGVFTRTRQQGLELSASSNFDATLGRLHELARVTRGRGGAPRRNARCESSDHNM